MKLLSELQARWRLLARREQRLLLAALALVLLTLLWSLALAPALATLKAAQQQRLALDAQWQQMQRLQAQAKVLQAAAAFELCRRPALAGGLDQTAGRHGATGGRGRARDAQL